MYCAIEHIIVYNTLPMLCLSSTIVNAASFLRIILPSKEVLLASNLTISLSSLYYAYLMPSAIMKKGKKASSSSLFLASSISPTVPSLITTNTVKHPFFLSLSHSSLACSRILSSLNGPENYRHGINFLYWRWKSCRSAISWSFFLPFKGKQSCTTWPVNMSGCLTFVPTA